VPDGTEVLKPGQAEWDRAMLIPLAGKLILLLRHADVRTTMNVYTQAVSELKREAHVS
jgi:hypothetical protein